MCPISRDQMAHPAFREFSRVSEREADSRPLLAAKIGYAISWKRCKRPVS